MTKRFTVNVHDRRSCTFGIGLAVSRSSPEFDLTIGGFLITIGWRARCDDRWFTKSSYEEVQRDNKRQAEAITGAFDKIVTVLDHVTTQ